jgi:hypothetical protein
MMLDICDGDGERPRVCAIMLVCADVEPCADIQRDCLAIGRASKRSGRRTREVVDGHRIRPAPDCDARGQGNCYHVPSPPHPDGEGCGLIGRIAAGNELYSAGACSRAGGRNRHRSGCSAPDNGPEYNVLYFGNGHVLRLNIGQDHAHPKADTDNPSSDSAHMTLNSHHYITLTRSDNLSAKNLVAPFTGLLMVFIHSWHVYSALVSMGNETRCMQYQGRVRSAFVSM